MSDNNVYKAGFTSSGISKGSLGSSMMSSEAKASGGGVRSGGPTSFLQELGFAAYSAAKSLRDGSSRGTEYERESGEEEDRESEEQESWSQAPRFLSGRNPGARGITHSSGYTSHGISGGSVASNRMSEEARSHGGGIPRGGTTSTVMSIAMGGKGGRR